jgi:hypothetical protein
MGSIIGIGSWIYSGGGGGAEVAFFTGSSDNNGIIGNIDSRTYVGQGSIDPGKTTTITSVEFQVGSIDGSPRSWVAEIFDATTANLGTRLGLSNAKTITGAGAVKFDGLSVAVTSGTSYHITIAPEDHNEDAVNFVRIGMYLSGDIYSGARQQWDSAKSNQGIFATNEVDVTLYEIV